MTGEWTCRGNVIGITQVVRPSSSSTTISYVGHVVDEFAFQLTLERQPSRMKDQPSYPRSYRHPKPKTLIINGPKEVIKSIKED